MSKVVTIAPLLFPSAFRRVAAAVLASSLIGCEPEPLDGTPCSSTSECCSDSPSSLCSTSDGVCQPNPFCAQDPNCFGSRFGVCTGTTPVGPGDNPDPSCPNFGGGSRPLSQPAFYCGEPGPSTVAIMADLNLFWRSQMVACACDTPDALAAGCQGNAFVLPATPGYIYYDRQQLQQLSDTTGAGLSAAWFIAHEAGHNMQLSAGMGFASGKARELSADCFAGFFVAWLGCTGRVDWQYSGAALVTACQVGDPFASPWFSETHGTCPERQQAVSLGAAAYQRGEQPWQACAF